MPILYIHGVGIREGLHDEEDAMRAVLKGIDWPSVQARLCQYVAPVLNPDHPTEVMIAQAYWGDLGATPVRPAQVDTNISPANLTPAALADELEVRLRRFMPMNTWPQVIEVAGLIAGNQDLRASWQTLSEVQQWQALQRTAEADLHKLWREHYPLEPWPWLGEVREDLHPHLMQHVKQLRGPLESFLPYFMGDILDYLLRRGSPQCPGAIPQRILNALIHMQEIKASTGEPIVVLTHSMGGQLLYDALSAFAPAQENLKHIQVDFWVAAASQLGLFASLNLFLEPTSAQGTLPPLQNLGYLWNVWSPTDLLSFQAAGALPNAHDIAMSLTDDAFQAHIEYIISPLFYQMFASKVRVSLMAMS